MRGCQPPGLEEGPSGTRKLPNWYIITVLMSHGTKNVHKTPKRLGTTEVDDMYILL